MVPSASAALHRQKRTYDRTNSVVFLKTRERYGGLSNMAGGFPLRVNGLRILTSEALYQACRFPHRPDLQRMVIEQRSPMTAKMKSKPHRYETRRDWNRVRVAIMRWCLRVKLAQNAAAFRNLLLSTGDLAIVEESRRDDFWGANPIDENRLVGVNALGRLLMELRELVKSEPQDSLLDVDLPSIPHFLLDGRPIQRIFSGRVCGRGKEKGDPPASAEQLRTVDSKVASSLLNSAIPTDSSPARKDSPEHRKEDDLAPSGTYAGYKNSGVEWLGEVPTHWDVLRVKAWLGVNQLVLPEDTDPDYTFDYVDIGSVTTGQLSARPERIRFGDAPSRARRVVRPGDTLFSTVRTYLKAVWHVEHLRTDLIASTGFAVFTPRHGTVPKFTSYFFQSNPFTDRVAAESVGMAYPAIAEARLGTLEVCVPPFAEQAEIVGFLDDADRHIRRYIRAKQKLIVLLEEQKQVLIHEAVTGRIDVRTGRPYPSYKDSEIKWLGAVPTHWQVRAAKWYFRESNHRSDTGSEELLSVSHITGVTPRSGKRNVSMFKAESNVGYKLCAPGDIVVNTMWAWMSALGIARQSGIVSPSYAVYRPRVSSTLNGEYVDLLLRTAPYQNEYVCRSTGIHSSRLRLYPEDFLRIRLLCPPAEEQGSIVDFVNRASDVTVRYIDRTCDEIARLEEYWERLIVDVVTGKFDVRGATAEMRTLVQF